MNLFIADIKDQTAYLSPDESHHLAKVLRLTIDDEVMVTDGKGNLYKGKVAIAHPKHSEINRLEKQDYTQKRDYKIEVAMAPTKQIDRTEWFLEKAIEVGLDAYHPIISFHSERRNLNIDRLRKRAISAMKQSLKAELPEVSDLSTFQDFVLTHKNFKGKKLIAHCNPSIPRKGLAEVFEPNQNYLFLIGPEGDFSEEEINFALENGFESISLGDQRLRTETAALSCAIALQWLK